MEGFAPWLFTLSRRMQPISTWSPSKTRDACFPNTNTFEVTFSVFPDLFSQRGNTMSFVSNHFQSQIDSHYNYHVIGKHGSSRLIDPQLFEAISFEMTPEKLTDLSAIDCTCLFMPLTWTPIPDRLQRILIDSFRLLYTWTHSHIQRSSIFLQESSHTLFVCLLTKEKQLAIRYMKRQLVSWSSEQLV